jgi:hypothetical protein
VGSVIANGVFRYTAESTAATTTCTRSNTYAGARANSNTSACSGTNARTGSYASGFIN